VSFTGCQLLCELERDAFGVSEASVSKEDYAIWSLVSVHAMNPAVSFSVAKSAFDSSSGNVDAAAEALIAAARCCYFTHNPFIVGEEF
jgi:hypothetical protein